MRINLEGLLDKKYKNFLYFYVPETNMRNYNFKKEVIKEI